jgi:predicted RNA-binding protein YlqC (UPF0109 family)
VFILQEPWEVDHWTWLLGVSKDELQKVIKKVGNSAEAVRTELGRYQMDIPRDVSERWLDTRPQ